MQRLVWRRMLGVALLQARLVLSSHRCLGKTSPKVLSLDKIQTIPLPLFEL